MTECSHLLVFCARKDPSGSVERFIKECDVDTQAPDYATALRKSVSTMSPGEFLSWSTGQTFLALGVGVTAAADARIGACPMNGFVPQDVHRVLQLPDNQWPVAYLAVGSTLDGAAEGEKERLKLRLPHDALFTAHKPQPWQPQVPQYFAHGAH